MAVLKRDTHYHTYADYLTWSGSYGDELVDGTAYVREPPAPTDWHQAIVLELGHQIATALEDKRCRVRIAPYDVRLPKSTEADDQVDTVSRSHSQKCVISRPNGEDSYLAPALGNSARSICLLQKTCDDLEAGYISEKYLC